MTTPLPLFNWQLQAEHERALQDRERLRERIARLRPHAHKRISLEERLRVLTLRLIVLETQLGGGRHGRPH